MSTITIELDDTEVEIGGKHITAGFFLGSMLWTMNEMGVVEFFSVDGMLTWGKWFILSLGTFFAFSVGLLLALAMITGFLLWCSSVKERYTSR